MANVKTSDETAATTPLTGPELVRIVQGGVNVKAAASAIAASKIFAATARIFGRKTAGSGLAEECTLSDILDFVGSAAQGDILYRGVATWTRLAAGTAKQMLQTAGSGANPAWAFATQAVSIAVSDETTALTTGTAKVTFRMPFAFKLTDIRASLSTAQTSGSIFTVNIKQNGTTIFSTKITIDNTEKTTVTAATPPVLSVTSLASDDEITVDIDQIGDGTAKGLKVYLIGYNNT